MPNATPPKRLDELLKAGKLGKKTGEGFYRWEKGKAVKGPADPVTEALVNRVMDPYLAEAKKAVDEGIVADADLADAGLIFGTGFAPFRGGPLELPAEPRLNRGSTGEQTGRERPVCSCAAASQELP